MTATVSDRKRPIDTNTDGTAEYYEPTILSATDYYPFGMDMPNRTFNAGDYRFGFNGKEADRDGGWGSLNYYDYGFRIYNPGIGRFLSVDPLRREYPSWTPYAFAMNRVIDGIDLDGLEWTARTFKETYSGQKPKSVTYFDVEVTVINNSTKFSSNDLKALKEEVQEKFKTTFSGFDQGNRQQFIANIIRIRPGTDQTQRDNNGLVIEITDNPILKSTKSYVGKVKRNVYDVGASQNNHINLIAGRDISNMANTFLHELGHAGGLYHIWEDPPEDIEGNVLGEGSPGDIKQLNKDAVLDYPYENIVIPPTEPNGLPTTSLLFKPNERLLDVLNNLMNSPANPFKFNVPEVFKNDGFIVQPKTTLSQLRQMLRKIDKEDER